MTIFGYTFGEWLVISLCGLGAGSVVCALSYSIVKIMEMVMP
jgi:hypothetical protein